MTYSSIQSNALSPDIINTNVQTLDSIKRLPSQREQLKKVSTEFEAIFITKMLNEMDKTVDREGGIFGSDDKYMDKFKSFIFDEVGRQIAKNPNSTVGFAKQIYTQMEKSLPKEALAENGNETGANAALGVKKIKVDKEI